MNKVFALTIVLISSLSYAQSSNIQNTTKYVEPDFLGTISSLILPISIPHVVTQFSDIN